MSFSEENDNPVDIINVDIVVEQVHFRPSPIGFAQVAQVQIPQPSKAQKGGEDAYFISKDKSVVGVFDGVGGSARPNIDPRDYAVKLAEGGQRLVNTTSERDPKKIMEAGFLEAKVLKGGSSTACIAVLNGNKVHMANLGDSGMFIIRPPNTSLFRSVEQQEGENFRPYQLPHDSIDSAQLEEIKVAEGDVVIVATDGVFDNIYNDEMISLVEKTVAAHKTADDLAHKLATAIANQASLAANDPKKVSPYVKRQGNRYVTGGKIDDITVVVGVVGKVENDDTVNQDLTNTPKNL